MHKYFVKMDSNARSSTTWKPVSTACTASLKMVIVATLVLLLFTNAAAEDYYFNAKTGNDSWIGTSSSYPWQSLSKIATLNIKAGDRILLASGHTFIEPLILDGVQGSAESPIVVSTYKAESGETEINAVIDPNFQPHAIWLKNVSFVEVQNLSVTTSQETIKNSSTKMRCGVLVQTTKAGIYEHIHLKQLKISSIFFEKEGFTRNKDEVKTANGTQNYGWGLRIINTQKEAILKDILLDELKVENVAHTGIKFTGYAENGTYSIQNVEVKNSSVQRTGGPGIQLSGVYQGHIHGNQVAFSGSTDDSRKWGRGSGLWTWSSANILIEKNSFTNANGPGDSAGAHIDFNCKNIVVQYNFSANNAGGFCEILGNNYNCSYRYNISVNDGHRVKGQNGAFQEGKVLWLSGYNGTKNPRKGPFNSYIYNNTIYVDNSIQAKVAIDRLSDGVLIANNIFHIVGNTMVVAGDQYRPEDMGAVIDSHPAFKNNLFLHHQSWPQNYTWKDASPVFGDAHFQKPGGLAIADYIPENAALIRDKGLTITRIAQDTVGLVWGLAVEKDILGRPIKNSPDLGAIEFQ